MHLQDFFLSCLYLYVVSSSTFTPQPRSLAIERENICVENSSVRDNVSPNSQIFKHLISIIRVTNYTSTAVDYFKSSRTTSTIRDTTQTVKTTPAIYIHYNSIRDDVNNFKSDRDTLLIDSKEPTSTNLQLKDDASCLSLGSALSNCESMTPGFTATISSAQAECLCYSAMTWAPVVFDNAVDGCASYASTAVPMAYEPLMALRGFCEALGDVKTGKWPVMATVMTSGISITTQSLYTSAVENLSGVSSRSRTYFSTNLSSTKDDSEIFLTSISTKNITIIKTTSESHTSKTGTESLTRFPKFDNLTISTILSESTTKTSTTVSITDEIITTTSSLSRRPTLFTSTLSTTLTFTTAVPPSDNISRARRTTGEWEVIWVSFCCAMVILFL